MRRRSRNSATLDASQLRPSVHPTYARLLVAELKRRGFSDDTIFAESRIGWEQLLREDRLVSLERFRTLALRGLELTEEPWLGLPVGRSTQLSSHGPLGYAIVASSSTRETLRLLERYSEIRLHIAKFEVVEGKERTQLVVRDLAGWGDITEYISHHIVGAVSRAFETVTGAPLTGSRALFPFSKTPWSERYADYLEGIAIEFDSPAVVLDLPNSVASAPCITADADAYEHAIRLCERETARHREGTNVAGRVLSKLLERKGDYPTLQEMAKSLGMSERTLIRKLKAEGTSYQRLLDDVRQELALWYLRKTDLPVDSVAERLGYRDTTNFSRTCRRWFGVTPKALRKTSGS
jgi:AraC-like DNA-binding protein